MPHDDESHLSDAEIDARLREVDAKFRSLSPEVRRRLLESVRQAQENDNTGG